MASAQRLRTGLAYEFATAAAFNGHSLDAAGDIFEMLFDAEEDMTISRLGFRQNAATLTATPPTYLVALKNQDPAGFAGSTTLGSGTHLASAANTNQFVWVNLGTPVAVTRGQKLSYTVQATGAVVPSGTNFIQIAGSMTGATTVAYEFSIFNAAGTRTRQLAMPVWGYGSTTKAYGNPLNNSTLINVNTGLTPDEIGIVFTVPTDLCSTYTLEGIRAAAGLTAGATARVRLYDSVNTVLDELDFDTDATTGSASRMVSFRFPGTLPLLTAGQQYRITMQSLSAVSVGLYSADVQQASDMSAYGLGTNLYWTSRKSAGAWTDLNTRRFVGNLLFGDWNLPAGSGTPFYAFRRF